MNEDNRLEKLVELIGSEVDVYIDRPLGSVHPKHKNIVYKVNYGYIKDYIALDGEYQDAYVLGVNKPIDRFNGMVIGVVNRLDDIEDKLIVCSNDKTYSIAEIEELLFFQEQYFRHKIILKDTNKY